MMECLFIANSTCLPEPGGWLQWEEVDNTKNHIVQVDPNAKAPAMKALLEYIHEGSKRHRGKDE
jgi:hypothetical protein